MTLSIKDMNAITALRNGLELLKELVYSYGDVITINYINNRFCGKSYTEHTYDNIISDSVKQCVVDSETDFADIIYRFLCGEYNCTNFMINLDISLRYENNKFVLYSLNDLECGNALALYTADTFNCTEIKHEINRYIARYIAHDISKEVAKNISVEDIILNLIDSDNTAYAEMVADAFQGNTEMLVELINNEIVPMEIICESNNPNVMTNAIVSDLLSVNSGIYDAEFYAYEYEMLQNISSAMHEVIENEHSVCFIVDSEGSTSWFTADNDEIKAAGLIGVVYSISTDRIIRYDYREDK